MNSAGRSGMIVPVREHRTGQTMNLRIPLKPREGYNRIFDIGEYGMTSADIADAVAGAFNAL